MKEKAMNVSLYKQLVNAKICLEKNSEIDARVNQSYRKIARNKHFLNACKSVEDYMNLKNPPFFAKAVKFFNTLYFPDFQNPLHSHIYFLRTFPLIAICELSFCVLYGFCYLISYPFLIRKKKAKYQKYKEEYEMRVIKAQKRIISLKNHIKDLHEEKDAFNRKAGATVAYLPNACKKNIDFIIYYVKTGQAHTLEEAMSLVAEATKETPQKPRKE